MATIKRFIAKNGLDNNSNTITNVSDPVNAQDAATKAFSSNAANLTSGVLPSARLPAFTGDATSTAGSTALTLATTGVTAGSYSNLSLTVDAKGRITAINSNSSIDGIAIGSTTPSTGAFTTLSASSTVTLSGGTANGVAYLNASKQVTSGSALTFDGTTFGINPNVANSTSLLITGAYTGSGTATMLAFQRTGGAVAGSIRYNDSAGDIEFGTTTSHPLAFIYGGSEQMRLTSTGLGIGTSSPSAKLNVVGEIRSSSDISNSSNAVIYSYAGGSAGSVRSGIQMVGTSQELRFYTAGSQNATLDSSGNLGLGVTPSAWSGTNTKSLDISIWTSLANGNAFGSALTFNGYYNGTNWIYKQNNLASKYESDGQHRWYIAPSGTAGNAISFTQAVTLDASGNLLVGATSANSNLGGCQNGNGFVEKDFFFGFGNSHTFTVSGDYNYVFEVTATAVGNNTNIQISEGRWVAGRRDYAGSSHIYNSSNIVGTGVSFATSQSIVGTRCSYTVTISNTLDGANNHWMIKVRLYANSTSFSIS